MESFKRVRILDVPVDMVNNRQALEVFEKFMMRQGCDLIVTPNSEIVLNATKDPELKHVLEEAGLIIPDGVGLVYASRILGEPLKERVTGVDFLSLILTYLEKEGKSIYLLGSKPANGEQEGVAVMAGKAMVEKHPKLIIAGARDGYFSRQEEPSIVAEINASGAEFLCVALGSPRQEKFIFEHKDEFLHVKAGMGVGGSLDVWAGTARRAPEFYQKHGLEWLFRFIQEPSRYKRMARLPLFIIKVIVKGKN